MLACVLSESLMWFIGSLNKLSEKPVTEFAEGHPSGSLAGVPKPELHTQELVSQELCKLGF